MDMRSYTLRMAQQRLIDNYRIVQQERAFIEYDTPALPGGDMGCFPAAYGKWMPPVQDLDALYTLEQREFNRTIAHKGMAQITDEDRAAAAKVGLTLCDFVIPAKGCDGWPGMRG